MNLTSLIPIKELAPGALGAIRNQVTAALVAKASTELKMPPENLVVRDIRPFSDLAWGTDAVTGLAKAALTGNEWSMQTDDALAGYLPLVTVASTIMADQRFVAIYGIRDSRFSHPTITAYQCSLWKIVVGNSVKSIWDASKLYAYRKEAVGVTNSAIIIPQNTQYQIYGYLPTAKGNVFEWVQLEGMVCEPRGKVVSP